MLTNGTYFTEPVSTFASGDADHNFLDHFGYLYNKSDRTLISNYKVLEPKTLNGTIWLNPVDNHTYFLPDGIKIQFHDGVPFPSRTIREFDGFKDYIRFGVAGEQSPRDGYYDINLFTLALQPPETGPDDSILVSETKKFPVYSIAPFNPSFYMNMELNFESKLLFILGTNYTTPEDKDKWRTFFDSVSRDIVISGFVGMMTASQWKREFGTSSPKTTDFQTRSVGGNGVDQSEEGVWANLTVVEFMLVSLKDFMSTDPVYSQDIETFDLALRDWELMKISEMEAYFTQCPVSCGSGTCGAGGLCVCSGPEVYGRNCNTFASPGGPATEGKRFTSSAHGMHKLTEAPTTRCFLSGMGVFLTRLCDVRVVEGWWWMEVGNFEMWEESKEEGGHHCAATCFDL